MVNRVSLLISCIFCATISMAIPIPQDSLEVQHFFRQNGGGLVGLIGNALVPIFGAILSNLATGIATTFNNGIAAGANANSNSVSNTNSNNLNTRPSSSNNNNPPSNNNINRPSSSTYNDYTAGTKFNAFMIHLPGKEEPYVLLTNQEPSEFTQGDENIFNPAAVGSKIQLQALTAQNGLKQDITTNVETTIPLLNEQLSQLIE